MNPYIWSFNPPLSISYDIIVKGHQGAIQVESEEGEYTEFKISLPI